MSLSDQDLFHRIMEVKDDPLAFVRLALPWGAKGTPLAGIKEPRSWQCEELEEVADFIRLNKQRVRDGLTPLVYKKAISSGRGIGKSAFSSMFSCWFLSCVIGGTQVVTANTEVQLRSKTFPEIFKWITLLVNREWLSTGVLKITPSDWYANEIKNQLKIDPQYYYTMGQTWSPERIDAFAGTHSSIGFALVMDEASGMPQELFDVCKGFYTEETVYRFWIALSNPRTSQGAFYNCFHGKAREFWRRRQIDSRAVEGIDKQEMENIIKEHGEDSDVARVEVKGEFPSHGDDQFIPVDTVDAAMAREVKEDIELPLVMGIDPARYGDNATVFYFRHGRDAASLKPIKIKNRDNMFVAEKAAEYIRLYKPDHVCVDAGQGTGVIDRLRELGYKVTEVWGSAASPNPAYYNHRTWLWAQMREWLRGGSIIDDHDLKSDLINVKYKFQGDKTLLESKKDMRKRGVPSPDLGDALAYTFAVKPIHPRVARARKRKRAKYYDPFSF